MKRQSSAARQPAPFVTVEGVRLLSENGRSAALVRLHNGCDFTVSGVNLRLSGKNAKGRREYLPAQEIAGLSVGPGESVSLPPIPVPPKWSGPEAELAFVRAGGTVCRLTEEGDIERTRGTLPPLGHPLPAPKRQSRNRVAFVRKTALTAAVLTAVLVFGLGLLGLFVSEIEQSRPTGPLKPVDPPEAEEILPPEPTQEYRIYFTI